MSKIFVFGTGRCGSTHLQRLITLSTRCWIWGEHEGFLEPLLSAVCRYESSPRLKRFVFERPFRDEAQLIADMTAGSQMLSWLNLLDERDCRKEITSVIDRMFRSRVPEGWRDWGFKEIRYGLDNNVPKMLLDLFSDALGIFSFREPKTTIESMIRTWSPGLMTGGLDLETLARIYGSYAVRWKKVMTYFLECDARAGDRIVFVSIEKLERPTADILGALGLTPARPAPAMLPVTNRGPRELPDWAKAKFDELFAEDAADCGELYARAQARSDADFARLPTGRRADNGLPAEAAATAP
jgi:hypothetical protein